METLINPARSPELRLPVYNSFREISKTNWFRKNKFIPILFLVIGTQAIAWQYQGFWTLGYRNRKFDEMQFTVDLGEFARLQPMRRAKPNLIIIDEVFGNQYVKDKKKVVDNTKRDFKRRFQRIASARNPVLAGGSWPVELNPSVNHLDYYTLAARQAGIEGTLNVELIISELGKVLRAQVVGKKLGYGIEKKVVRDYYKKKFRPSFNGEGEPMTSKIIHRVRLVLR